MPAANKPWQIVCIVAIEKKKSLSCIVRTDLKKRLSTGYLLSIITYVSKTCTESRVTFDSFSFFSLFFSFSFWPDIQKCALPKLSYITMLDKVLAESGVKIGCRIDCKLRFLALYHHKNKANIYERIAPSLCLLRLK